MTIPIQPGPFSFLAGAGEALGAYAQEKEKKRQQGMKEAQDRLTQMISLRAAGLVPPESFGTPEMKQLYQTLGIMPVSDQPTPEEQITGLKGEYLTALKQPDQQIQIPLGALGLGVNQTAKIPATARFSDEQRAIAGLPQRGLGQKIEAGIAQDVAAVPTAQLQGTTAQAQIPGARDTALSTQFKTQDEQFDEQAYRNVTQLFNQTGKIPTDAEAFQAAQSDPRYQAFGPQKITQPYFGKAIQRLKDEQEKLRIARQAANTRAQAAGPEAKDILKLQEDKIGRLNALIGKDKPSDEDYRNQGIAQLYTQQGNPVPPFLSGSVKRVEDYEKSQNEIRQQINQAQTDYDRMASQFPSIAPPRSTIGTSGSPEKRAAAQEFEARTKGVSDPAQRKKIADEIAEKYGLKPHGAGGKF